MSFLSLILITELNCRETVKICEVKVVYWLFIVSWRQRGVKVHSLSEAERSKVIHNSSAIKLFIVLVIVVSQRWLTSTL